MAGSLQGCTALVTGAGKGIGRGIAGALLADGARVALLDLDRAGVADAIRAFEAPDDRTLALFADVWDPDQIDALAEVVDRWGHADILVNNAAATVSRSVWTSTSLSGTPS